MIMTAHSLKERLHTVRKLSSIHGLEVLAVRLEALIPALSLSDGQHKPGLGISLYAKRNKKFESMKENKEKQEKEKKEKKKVTTTRRVVTWRSSLK